MPAMESKTADVFAFGMFAVEVFTGKIPFGEQKNEAVVLRISEGGRPEMPENAQAVGLTGEIWALLESCWQHDPKKRPTMEEVVMRWEKFVENSNEDKNLFLKCVQISLLIWTSFSVSFSTSYDRPRELPPTQGTSRNRTRTEAPKFQTKSATARSRAHSEAPHLRNEAHQLKTFSNTPDRPRTNAAVVRPRAKSELVHQSPISEVSQSINSRPAQTPAPAPQPSESAFSEGYQSQVLIHYR